MAYEPSHSVIEGYPYELPSHFLNTTITISTTYYTGTGQPYTVETELAGYSLRLPIRWAGYVAHPKGSFKLDINLKKEKWGDDYETTQTLTLYDYSNITSNRWITDERGVSTVLMMDFSPLNLWNTEITGEWEVKIRARTSEWTLGGDVEATGPWSDVITISTPDHKTDYHRISGRIVDADPIEPVGGGYLKVSAGTFGSYKDIGANPVSSGLAQGCFSFLTDEDDVNMKWEKSGWLAPRSRTKDITEDVAGDYWAVAEADNTLDFGNKGAILFWDVGDCGYSVDDKSAFFKFNVITGFGVDDIEGEVDLKLVKSGWLGSTIIENTITITKEGSAPSYEFKRMDVDWSENEVRGEYKLSLKANLGGMWGSKSLELGSFEDYPPASIEGYVETEAGWGSGDPVDGATVQVYGIENTRTAGIFRETTTDNDGYYGFASLEWGDYYVFATKENHSLENDFVELRGDDESVDIEIIPPQVVEGTVYNLITNTPLAGALVELTFDGETLTTYTNSDGEFIFENVSPTDCAISITHENYAVHLTDNFEVDSAEDLGEISLIPLATARIEGRVYWENSYELENITYYENFGVGAAHLKATFTRNFKTYDLAENYSGDNGEYVLYVPPEGTYKIKVEHDNYKDEKVSVNVGSGETPIALDIELDPSGGWGGGDIGESLSMMLPLFVVIMAIGMIVALTKKQKKKD